MPLPETIAFSTAVPSLPLGPTIIGIVVPIVALLLVFGLPAVIVFIVLRHKSNRARMLQETILKLAEIGHPIPAQLLEGNLGEPSDKWDKKSPLHKGVILTAVGIGLVVMLLSMGVGSWGVGLIPLLMGLGYLLIWKLEDKNPG